MGDPEGISFVYDLPTITVLFADINPFHLCFSYFLHSSDNLTHFTILATISETLVILIHLNCSCCHSSIFL